jgi:hypothetical protein
MRHILPLILLTLTATGTSNAAPWNELEAGSVIRLKEELPVREGLSLPKGATMALQSVDFFGPPYLASFSMRWFPCPDALANERTGLLILDRIYGFELDWNCKISLMLEIRDFYRESYFEKTE